MQSKYLSSSPLGRGKHSGTCEASLNGLSSKKICRKLNVHALCVGGSSKRVTGDRRPTPGPRSSLNLWVRAVAAYALRCSSCARWCSWVVSPTQFVRCHKLNKKSKCLRKVFHEIFLNLAQSLISPTYIDQFALDRRTESRSASPSPQSRSRVCNAASPHPPVR